MIDFGKVRTLQSPERSLAMIGVDGACYERDKVEQPVLLREPVAESQSDT